MLNLLFCIGNLWEQVFHHGCASKNYLFALTALCESPQTSKVTPAFSVKAIVVSMCKQACVDELLSFPFGNRSMFVVEALKSLGASASMNAKPQPYEILYSWHKQSGDYQSAAEALIMFARKIEEKALHTPGTIQVIYKVLGELSYLCIRSHKRNSKMSS